MNFWIMVNKVWQMLADFLVVTNYGVENAIDLNLMILFWAHFMGVVGVKGDLIGNKLKEFLMVFIV